MTKISRIVLATAAATGLSFSPVLACPYMKTSEQAKPLITAKADIPMSTTDKATVIAPLVAPAEATDETKPEEKATSIE